MTTSPGTTDEEVVATFADESRSRTEREAAFAELVQRYDRRVYAICYRFFGEHADAEDAAQDTFLTVARRAGQFRGDSALSTWIYRIAVNACNDLGRKHARRPSIPVEDVSSVASIEALTTDDEAIGLETADAIQRALLQLDELSRTLIILCAIEEQPYPEVAAALDLPIGTVKSRVSRARAKLALILRPELAGEERDVGREAGSPQPSNPEVQGPSAPRGPPG